MTDDEAKCCVCGKTNKERAGPHGDLRPYGPGGAGICFVCAFSTPELADEARYRQAHFAATQAIGMLQQAEAGMEPEYGPDVEKH